MGVSSYRGKYDVESSGIMCIDYTSKCVEFPGLRLGVQGEMNVFTWYYRRVWISNRQGRQSYGHVVIQDRSFFFLFFLAAKGKEADIIRSTFRPLLYIFLYIRWNLTLTFIISTVPVRSPGGRKCAKNEKKKKKEKSLCQQQQQHTGPVVQFVFRFVIDRSRFDDSRPDVNVCVCVCQANILTPPLPPIVFVIYMKIRKKSFQSQRLQ